MEGNILMVKFKMKTNARSNGCGCNGRGEIRANNTEGAAVMIPSIYDQTWVSNTCLNSNQVPLYSSTSLVCV